jgi:hypothetical protein
MPSYVYGCGPCCERNSQQSSLFGPHGRGYGPRLTLIGNSNNGTMEHPGTILDDWDGVTMAGAGYSEEVLSEGAPDVLDEKWKAALLCSSSIV